MLVSRQPNGEPEIFASIQGEGISVGVPSIFVRLAECNLKCEWCFVPDTPVLMANWTWRPIGELRPGDSVVGIEQPGERGKHVKLATGTVQRISLRCAQTVLVNDAVRCTPDHKFWLTGRDANDRAGAVHSGWREIHRAVGMKVLFTTEPQLHDEADYRRGWLAGMADGDGCFWTLKYRRGYRRFRLALNDAALLDRAEAFATASGYSLEAVLERLALTYTPEMDGFHVHRRRGQAWRALSLARPRKQSLLDESNGHHPHDARTIHSVVDTGQLEEVVTLSTTLGSFVAAGYVVKNCDTKYTWKWDDYDREKETSEITTSSVLGRITELASTHTRNIVLTGGEPLLQQPALVELTDKLRGLGFRIEIETNGTIQPTPELAANVDQWNVSPKLENSANKKTARLRTGPLGWFADAANSIFKFVVAEPGDLDEVRAVANQYGVPAARVLVMPEGTDPTTLNERSRWLVEACRLSGFRFGTRLHVLLWGSERAR